MRLGEFIDAFGKDYFDMIDCRYTGDCEFQNKKIKLSFKREDIERLTERDVEDIRAILKKGEEKDVSDVYLSVWDDSLQCCLYYHTIVYSSFLIEHEKNISFYSFPKDFRQVLDTLKKIEKPFLEKDNLKVLEIRGDEEGKKYSICIKGDDFKDIENNSLKDLLEDALQEIQEPNIER